MRRGGAARKLGGDEGFMLLGLIVAIAVILLMLSVAASEVAFSLRREKEVESARRADQYVRAIRKFYIKNQHYPGSLEQLENTNMVRYLRQRYVDPLTGKADYRLIPVGQNKTTVKGFFGQPLAGIASTGLGSAAGMQSAGIAGPTTANGTSGALGAAGAAGAGATDTGGASATASSGVAGTSGSTPGAGTFGSAQTGTGFPSSTLPGTTGPIMGVGSSATGPSILTVNDQTTYETWEFLYDPRIEKLKAAAALNTGVGSANASSLGTTPGAFGTAGTPGTAAGGTSTTTSPGAAGSAAPTGTTPTTQP